MLGEVKTIRKSIIAWIDTDQCCMTNIRLRSVQNNCASSLLTHLFTPAIFLYIHTGHRDGEQCGYEDSEIDLTREELERYNQHRMEAIVSSHIILPSFFQLAQIILIKTDAHT